MFSVEGVYTTVYFEVTSPRQFIITYTFAMIMIMIMIMMVATLFTMTTITRYVSALSGTRSKTPNVASMSPGTFLSLLLGFERVVQ